jgi:hypothetical protein
LVWWEKSAKKKKSAVEQTARHCVFVGAVFHTGDIVCLTMAEAASSLEKMLPFNIRG